eukprot:COSAG02_NODE_57_length_43668_cov_118.217196_9_plen_68_part_00
MRPGASVPSEDASDSESHRLPAWGRVGDSSMLEQILACMSRARAWATTPAGARAAFQSRVILLYTVV